jgi:hypothetical protein
MVGEEKGKENENLRENENDFSRRVEPGGLDAGR